MKKSLKTRGKNQTVLQLGNGTEIFFSYSTPVAGHFQGGGFFRTDTFFSTTTSRHINKYLKDENSEVVQIWPQDRIEALL